MDTCTHMNICTHNVCVSIHIDVYNGISKLINDVLFLQHAQFKYEKYLWIYHFYGEKTSPHTKACIYSGDDCDIAQKECWVTPDVNDASSRQESSDHEGCALQAWEAMCPLDTANISFQIPFQPRLWDNEIFSKYEDFATFSFLKWETLVNQCTIFHNMTRIKIFTITLGIVSCLLLGSLPDTHPLWYDCIYMHF